MKKHWKAGLLLLAFISGAFIMIAGAGAQSPEDPGNAGEAGSAPSLVEGLEQLDPNRLVLTNEYIAVAVNRSPDGTGRFGVKVTGGDPFRSGDEEQPLIYGFEEPWTSYTTVRIDGNDYIFGGRTRKRSGGTGTFGQVITGPELDAGKGSLEPFAASIRSRSCKKSPWWKVPPPCCRIPPKSSIPSSTGMRNRGRWA